MLKILVVDSSSLIALERVQLLDFLEKLNYGIVVPKKVYEEIKINKPYIKVKELVGKTKNEARKFQKLNIGSGEAECCALALSLRLNFIICDDNKFINKMFYLNNPKLFNLKILGFSFFLHEFFKNKIIDNIWVNFDKIIKLNNWERSEIQVANYTFLKEMGY